MPVTATVNRSRSIGALLVALATALAVVAASTPARASTPQLRTVHYRGATVRVPAGWPVVSLAAHPRACVRFDRHAVYLGRPGAAQRCPAHAAGHTEAILVSPAPRSGDAHAMVAPSGGSAAHVSRDRGAVRVTATWHRHPALVRAALGGLSPQRLAATQSAGAASSPTSGSRPARAAAHARAGHEDFSVTPTGGGGSAGAVYTGLGFDACSAPSSAALSAWQSSPFRAVGVYIGGSNMACSQPNLTPDWVSAESSAGWHLIPIYVGLQAPSSGCGCATISGASAAGQGTAAAQDAIAHADALGLGAGNPIYYDMEGYSRGSTASAAVLAFLSAWTGQLHLAGYQSGVYSSAASGIADLVSQQGTGYAEPDDLWIANWNGQQSTADPAVPAADWPNHQRMHQYRGGHTDNYGGATISIDSDYVDAATAAPGSNSITTTIAAAPSISVHPAPDGTLTLSPSWSGERGVHAFRIMAGGSPTGLSPALTVGAGRRSVVMRSAYRYFQVQALDASGTVMGSSGVVPTPAHVAVFGRSSFVPAHGPGGLPVKCFGISACRVTTTIWAGHQKLATTRPQSVPGNGGIVHFTLTGSDHRRVAHAAGHHLAVTAVVRATGGQSARTAVDLVPFSIAGRGPRVRGGGSRALLVLGTTDFVSHGWTGGVLAACVSSTPCLVTTTLTAAGGAAATSHPQTIGAGMVGYIGFRMNARGHRLLLAAHGNRLGARVTLSTAPTPTAPATRAQALLSLSSF